MLGVKPLLPLLLGSLLSVCQAQVYIKLDCPSGEPDLTQNELSGILGQSINATIMGNVDGETCSVSAKLSDLGPLPEQCSKFSSNSFFEKTLSPNTEPVGIGSPPVVVNIDGPLRIPQVCGEYAIVVGVKCGDYCDQNQIPVKVPCMEDPDLLFEIPDANPTITAEPDKLIESNYVLDIINRGKSPMAERLLFDALDVETLIFPADGEVMMKFGLSETDSPQTVTDALFRSNEMEKIEGLKYMMYVMNSGIATVDASTNRGKGLGLNGDKISIPLDTLKMYANPYKYDGLGLFIAMIDPMHLVNDMNYSNNGIALFVNVKPGKMDPMEDGKELMAHMLQPTPLVADVGNSAILPDMGGYLHAVFYNGNKNSYNPMYPPEKLMEALLWEGNVAKDTERLLELEMCNQEILDDTWGKQLSLYQFLYNSLRPMVEEFMAFQPPSDVTKEEHANLDAFLTFIGEAATSLVEGSRDTKSFMSQILVYYGKKYLSVQKMRKEFSKDLDRRFENEFGMNGDERRGGSGEGRHRGGDMDNGYPFSTYGDMEGSGERRPPTFVNREGSGERRPPTSGIREGSGERRPPTFGNREGSGERRPATFGNREGSGERRPPTFGNRGESGEERYLTSGGKRPNTSYLTTNSADAVKKITRKPPSGRNVEPTKGPQRDPKYFCIKDEVRNEIEQEWICDDFDDCDGGVEEEQKFCKLFMNKRLEPSEIQDFLDRKGLPRMAAMKNDRKTVKLPRRKERTPVSEEQPSVEIKSYDDLEYIMSSLSDDQRMKVNALAMKKRGVDVKVDDDVKSDFKIAAMKSESSMIHLNNEGSEVIADFAKNIFGKSSAMKRKPNMPDNFRRFNMSGGDSEEDTMRNLMEMYGGRSHMSEEDRDMQKVMEKFMMIMMTDDFSGSFTVLPKSLIDAAKNVFTVMHSIEGSRLAEIHDFLQGNSTEEYMMDDASSYRIKRRAPRMKRKMRGDILEKVVQETMQEDPFNVKAIIDNVIDFILTNLTVDARIELEGMQRRDMLEVLSLVEDYLGIVRSHSQDVANVVSVMHMMNVFPEGVLKDIDGYPGVTPDWWKRCMGLVSHRAAVMMMKKKSNREGYFMDPTPKEMISRKKESINRPAYWEVGVEGKEEGTVMRVKFSRITGMYHYKVVSVAGNMPGVDYDYTTADEFLYEDEYYFDDDDDDDDNFANDLRPKRPLNGIKFDRDDMDDERFEKDLVNKIENTIGGMRSGNRNDMSTVQDVVKTALRVARENGVDDVEGIVKRVMANRGMDTSKVDLSAFKNFMKKTRSMTQDKKIVRLDAVSLIRSGKKQKSEENLEDSERVVVSGIVQVSKNGTKTTVCKDGWGPKESLVFCNHLQINNKRYEHFETQTASPTEMAASAWELPPIHMSDVKCDGQDIKNLLQCTYLWSQDSNHSKCSSGQRAAVTCIFVRKDESERPK